MKNKKRIITLILALMLFATAVFPAFAADLPRLIDNAELLSQTQQSKLLSKLDEISERQQADIVIVTVDSIGDYTPQEYADDFYDYYGYGYGDNKDGVLLLVNMGERDWYISTTGYGITAITDAGLDYISDKFVSKLSDGDYDKAFMTYAKLCDKFFTQAKTGKPYDVGNMPKEPFDIVMSLIISLAIGLAVAFIATGIMKSKLKTVRYQSAAGNYVRANSMNVTTNSDLFLYTHIDRHEKPQNNSSSGGSSTHTSSSGSTHGGGGGKF